MSEEPCEELVRATDTAMLTGGNAMQFHAIETMPFGDIALNATGVSPATETILAVQRAAPIPKLPKGMHVEFLAAIFVALSSENPVHDFVFDCRVVECWSNGSPKNGECLAAQSWQVGNGLLMMGTEDGDALQARMGWLKRNSYDEPITWLPDGFRLSFPFVPAKHLVDFHFVIAHNRIDREDDSEWFAVDIPHRHIWGSKTTTIVNEK